LFGVEPGAALLTSSAADAKQTHTIDSSKNESRVVPLKELERKAIIDALSHLGYNATQAAKSLGISKATLYRKLREYDVSRRLVVWA
jgi:transcriptional regulator of acetoin/glycerol metabolism